MTEVDDKTLRELLAGHASADGTIVRRMAQELLGLRAAQQVAVRATARSAASKQHLAAFLDRLAKQPARYTEREVCLRAAEELVTADQDDRHLFRQVMAETSDGADDFRRGSRSAIADIFAGYEIALRTFRLPLPRVRLDLAGRRMTHCQSNDDGDCSWTDCPQRRDGEPQATGRHCPLDIMASDEE